MPPQVNAELLTVTARTSTDEFRAPTTTGATVWSGRAGAWYEERRRRVSGVGSGGAVVSDVLIERSLDVDPQPAAAIEEGPQVTIAVAGMAGTVTAIVQAIERNHYDVVPDYLNTTRLTLELA